MCDPITIASIGLAMSIASTGVAVVQQQAQAEFQKKKAANAVITAKQNLGNKLTQLELRRDQERQKAMGALQNITRKALKSQGLAVATAASEGGTGGASVDALVGDFAQQQLNQMDLIDQNLDIMNLQINQKRLGAEAQANAEQLAGMGAGVPMPDYASHGLQILDYGSQLGEAINADD